MMHSSNKGMRRSACGERGSSRVSLIIVLLVIAVVAYVAYQLVPVIYNAALYRDYMQHTVDKAIATGKDEAWVKDQLSKTAADDYELPTDTRVETHLSEGRMIVRVYFTRPIQFPGYTYQYNFDHTVKSAKFLSD